MYLAAMEHRALLVHNEPFLSEMRNVLSETLRGAYRIDAAHNSRDAIKLLETNRFDVVVTGLDVPGMDGKQFLARILLHQPDCPRVIISEYAGRLKLSQCLFVGHRYFNKPCDLKALSAFLLKLASYRDVVGNEKIRRVVGGLGSLPGPPETFLKLEKLLSAGTSSIDDVAEVVEQDPMMLAKLLQIANSAQFGLQQPVYAAVDAVQILGLVTVRVLILGLQAFTAYEKRTGKKPAPSGLWDHSVRVASKARTIAHAQNFSSATAERAFVAGLLHDVGRIVINANAPEECAEVEELIRRCEVPSLVAETERFGATYADIGAYLLALWGIDDEVAAIVQYQDRLEAPKVTDKKALAALHVAHADDSSDAVGFPLQTESLAKFGFPDAAHWANDALTVP
jgi:HD-like signal output (HDOD) protein/ActR/RegA family two-component response regulator